MRKIMSQAELEEKRKKNVFFLSVFMLVVLVLGTVGYGFIARSDSSTTNEDTSGLEEGAVTSYGDKWLVNLGGQIFQFSNSLEEVENISTNILLDASSFSGQIIYIDSKNPSVTAELVSTLRVFSPQIKEACFNSCPERDIPEKDCTNNLIIWKDSAENKIYQEEKCIFIDGDLHAVDAFLYKLLGLKHQAFVFALVR